MSTRITIDNRAATHYGARTAEDKLPAQTSTMGMEKEMVVHFNYDDLPGPSTTDDANLKIPAKSLILSADLHVTTAFAGGTSLAIGAQETDGTEIDNDGFITDANAPLANLNAAGKKVVGSGALIEAVSSLTADAQVKVTATGSFTAGQATLRIRYVPEYDMTSS